MGPIVLLHGPIDGHLTCIRYFRLALAWIVSSSCRICSKKKVLHAESSRKTRMKMHSRGDGSDGDYYGPLKKKMENTMVETKKNARIL